MTDLIGRRFGRLTVVGDGGRSKNGSILWRCRCDCGGEALYKRHELTGGYAVSCGCEKQGRELFSEAEDLTGRRFGGLTVLERAPNNKNNRVCWRCRCDCGNTCVVPAVRLKTGHTRSCGCLLHAPSPMLRDLTGMRFGRLTALCRAKAQKSGGTLWRCRCDCGTELDVYAGSLLRGQTRSCGCLNREVGQKMHEHMHYQDDTCIEMLERSQKNWAENKAGFRGLFLTKSGKYRVAISFRKKHYTIGYYKTFDEAVKTRLNAEQTLHAGYIEASRRYEARAREDPAWAESNPFYYDVFQEGGQFRVSTNG